MEKKYLQLAKIEIIKKLLLFSFVIDYAFPPKHDIQSSSIDIIQMTQGENK